VAESRSVSQNGVRLYTAGCRLVLLRIHAVFKWIAERAALKLGHAGGPAAVFFWLDLLKPNFRGGIHGSLDGTETHHECGSVDRVMRSVGGLLPQT